MYDSCMSELERVTVNLIPKASKALYLAMNLTGDSKTDTINRALQCYAFFAYESSTGKDILLRKDGGEEVDLVTFL